MKEDSNTDYGRKNVKYDVKPPSTPSLQHREGETRALPLQLRMRVFHAYVWFKAAIKQGSILQSYVYGLEISHI